ncbi:MULTISPECIES: serine/threonine-protein kinase [unclassified Streptomyces]|uniref:serine/threonine-protein kinase n=1 Tax=unclassified Streptomyces TaxID=2593676 RepID=UPI00081F404E|nr:MULTISPECIES: serine/threonine-protein kinase [unclassified Streptomyces]MYR98056.1 transporter substrate-binding domain-containing protein [Streptomyces sp. SID4937]SCE33391.1 serine/threonine protein kinase with extracellular ligand sensor(s) [Streptomyces sp. ScaeMP-e83]
MQGEDRSGAGAEGGAGGGAAGDGAADGRGGPQDRWAGDGLQRADSGTAQEWPPTPPRTPSPGRPQVVIEGRYELLEPIGSGGMGEVWRAHDRRLRRFVAVKGLLDRNAMTASTQAAAMQRARREAEAIAKIEHPNVVTVHDQVETDNQVWIVMKLLEARSLADLLRAERVLAVPRAADIGLQILQGLRAVHTASVVHRDVKPGNVLVRDDGLAILVDFGIATFEGAAQVTRSGSVIGTPPYLAPELFAPGSPGPTPASDLWALGITLYEMVEGRVPFAGGEVWEVQENIRQTPDPALRYAGPLAPVIQGLLFPDPHERLDAATAEAMLREVLGDPPPRNTTGSEPATHPPTAVSEPRPDPLGPPVAAPRADGSPARRSARKRPWLRAATATLCVALLGTAGWLVAKGVGDDKDGTTGTTTAGSGGRGGGSAVTEKWKATNPTLKIGVKDDQPGLSKYDRKTDTYAGYDIDLAYAIAGHMGYSRNEVAFTTVPTDYRSTALKTKGVDLVIASYSITPERKSASPGGYSVDFAGPYYEASRGFLVREKSSKYTINDSSDLRRLKVEVCTARDSTYETELPKRGFTMTESQPNTYQDCLDQLLDVTSDVYAVASDDIILAGYEKANPGKVRRLENIQGAEGYGVAMRPGSPGLKSEVCSALRKILAGKVWEDMYAKNLSTLLDNKNPPGRPDLTECEGY